MVTVAVIINPISKSQLTDFLLINLSCLVFIDSSVVVVLRKTSSAY